MGSLQLKRSIDRMSTAQASGLIGPASQLWLPTSNRQFSRTDASASMWSDRNLEKFALQDRHCIAAQNDSIGFNSDMDNPTSFGRLIAGHRRFAQSPRPVRTETAVCRARHGILIYSS